jgi:pyruvate dehydrogenase E2 component (dihydrolipoamide acetyltransferase)
VNAPAPAGDLDAEGRRHLLVVDIYPPQVALVGFGKVAERPWAEGGLLGARPTVMATLAADHRVSDGHRGGLFLSTIDHLLQAPEDL